MLEQCLRGHLATSPIPCFQSGAKDPPRLGLWVWILWLKCPGPTSYARHASQHFPLTPHNHAVNLVQLYYLVVKTEIQRG